jgi:hypothetical protein
MVRTDDLRGDERQSYYSRMLSELHKVPQERQGFRRWFADDELDLIVWYSESGEINGFQLCYDLSGRERAFTWKHNTGLRHAAVDIGDQSPLADRSPILVYEPIAPVEKVVADFNARAETLDPHIASFVATTISGFRRRKS